MYDEICTRSMHSWFLMCSFGEFKNLFASISHLHPFFKKVNHTTLRMSCTYSSSPFSPGAGGDDNGCFPASATVIGRMGPIRMEDVRWEWVWVLRWFKHLKMPQPFMKAGVKVEKICTAGFQMENFPAMYVYLIEIGHCLLVQYVLARLEGR